MEEMNAIEAWVYKTLNFDVDGIALLDLLSFSFRYVLGDWVLSPAPWILAMAGCLAWLLCWSLVAVRLYRRGYWVRALFCFGVGYEVAWQAIIILYIAADRLAQLIVFVLPFFGWTFTVVSALTAIVFWQHGVQRVVFGLPGLLLNFAGNRGWIKIFRGGDLRNPTPL